MSQVFLKIRLICGAQNIWLCAGDLCVFAHEDGTCEVMKFITDAAVHACESLELCKIYFMLRCHDFVSVIAHILEILPMFSGFSDYL